MSSKQPKEVNSIPRRPLGRTGEEVPILGLGTGPCGIGLEDRIAIPIYERAIDLGIDYIDTSPVYGRAQVQLGEVMRRRRAEIFLATKVTIAPAAEALKTLEQNLRDLQTDQVDLVYAHSIGRKDLEQVTGPGGTLEGLREARRRGWTRYIGVTSHDVPWKMARVLEETELDVVMATFNFADRYTYDFEKQVLPLAQKRGVGVAAMKVYGGALNWEYERPLPSELSRYGDVDHELALRYALGLDGVAIAVVGVYSERELEQNVEWARRYHPLDDIEKQKLAGMGREIAALWGPHCGAVR